MYKYKKTWVKGRSSVFTAFDKAMKSFDEMMGRFDASFDEVMEGVDEVVARAAEVADEADATDVIRATICRGVVKIQCPGAKKIYLNGVKVYEDE